MVPGIPRAIQLEDLAIHCHNGGNSGLFCTSYSYHCDRQFINKRNSPTDHNIVSSNACFGDITIDLARNGPSVTGHDRWGPERRRFGFCGNVNTGG